MKTNQKVQVVRGPLGGWLSLDELGSPKSVKYDVTVPTNAIGVVVGKYVSGDAEMADRWFIVKFERHDDAANPYDGHDVYVPVSYDHVRPIIPDGEGAYRQDEDDGSWSVRVCRACKSGDHKGHTCGLADLQDLLSF